MDTAQYKEMEDRYAAEDNEKRRIDLLIGMAMELRNYDVERAIAMADDIIGRSVAERYRLGEGRGLNLKGWLYWRLGNYDDGEEVLRAAYAIAEEIRNAALEARVLNNFGYIYRDRGDLGAALSSFEGALAINQKLGDEVAQNVNLASIAYVHYDLGDYDNALEFALRCLPIFKAANDVHRLTSLYHILGNIYFKKGSYRQALHYFEETVAHSEPATIMRALALSGLGKVYYKMRAFGPATQHLDQALELGMSLGDVEVPITCYFYQGRLSMDEGHYRRAQACLDRAYKMATDYSRRHDMMSIHEMLSALYDAMGNIPQAFHHLKEYEKMKEEIFRQTTFDQLRNLQSRQQVELARKEKEVAERTANLKQQFMANMSHEIRTPMNAIVGMTRLLLEKSPRQEQLRYLSAIQQSADSLLVIINDILDLSKIEAGKIMLEKTGFSLRDIFRSISDMLMLRAEDKGIGLQLEAASEVPARLLGDPTRIGQVLVNLVGNAVKFTDKGGVRVTASVAARKGERYTIRLDVADTGIGISQDYVDKIFESFTQAGSDTARKFGGTGLGLTISKQLTELMGGEISVRSEEGKGTTFSVALPLELAEEAAPAGLGDGLGEAELERLRGLRVLLVEDNEFNRMVAEDTLQDALPGLRLETAVNGREAFDLAASGRYDAILMDIQMPVMDGIAATRAIRGSLQGAAAAVPIIAMTANVLQEDVQQYFAEGMNGYLSKPFQPKELLARLAEATAGNAAEAATGAPAAEPSLPPLPQKLTSMDFLRSLTGGNSEKMHKYRTMFLDNAPKLLATIEAALAGRDLPALKIAAHSLKPQLSYMGVREEISNIYLIEQTAGEQGHFERLPELVRNLGRVCAQVFAELEGEAS